MQAIIQNKFLSLTVDTHGAEAVSLKNAAGEELLRSTDGAQIEEFVCALETESWLPSSRTAASPMAARPTRAASTVLPGTWSTPC